MACNVLLNLGVLDVNVREATKDIIGLLPVLGDGDGLTNTVNMRVERSSIKTMFGRSVSKFKRMTPIEQVMKLLLLEGGQNG